MEARKIIVAIDGHSSCGKSTLAKALAERLQYTYVDSGAMYRAVTLYLLRNNIALDDDEAIAAALGQINIRFVRTPDGARTLLNDEDVEEEIRQMYVSDHVSEVSAVPRIRREMVRLQQAMGAEKGLVMDGRDIGTVVFPKAELKIFLTADPEERTRRRFDELLAKGVSVSMDEVRRNLAERDHIDSTRGDSPLRKAADAVIIDNTELSPQQQLQLVLDLVRERAATIGPGFHPGK